MLRSFEQYNSLKYIYKQMYNISLDTKCKVEWKCLIIKITTVINDAKLDQSHKKLILWNIFLDTR